MDPVAQRGCRLYLGPVVLAVVVHLGIVAVYLHRHNSEISSLVCAADADLARPDMTAVRVSFDQGYDGSAYYRIACQPWHCQDCVAVRHLRIVYPFLSWALAAGDSTAVLWTMPVVNVLAIAGLTLLAGMFAVRHGLSPWWGCLLPFAVNAVLPTLRNLGDLTALLALGSFLVVWMQRRSPLLLLVCGLLTMLSREQNVAVVGLVFLLSLRERPREALALVLALLGWLAWVAVVRQLHDEWPFLPGQGNFTWPFAGLIECNQERLHHWPRKLYVRFTMADALILFQIALSVALLRWRVSPALKATALVTAAQAVLGGRFIYCDLWSMGRVYSPMTLAVFLACLQRGTLWPLSLLASFTPLAIYLGVLR